MLARLVFQGNPWYSALDIHSTLFSSVVGNTKFSNLAKAVATTQLVTATHQPHMFAAFKQAGITHCKAGSHTIMDHLGLMELLKQLHSKLPIKHQGFVESLQRQLDASVPQQLRAPTPPPPPVVILAAAQAAGPSTPTDQFCMPEHGVPMAELNVRYGLRNNKAIMNDLTHPYIKSLTSMKSWYCNALQPDRAGCSMAKPTWKHEEDNVHLFIGFAVKWCQGAASLSTYQNVNTFMRFLAMQKEKKNSLNTLQAHCSTAKKVLQFSMRCTDNGSAEGQRLMKVVEEMGRLYKQMPNYVSRKRKQVGLAIIA